MKKSQKILSRRFWDENELVKRVKKSFDTNGSAELEIEHLCDDDLIIFDDMGSTSITDWKKDLLFKLIDFRYILKSPTIITSNFRESEIKEKFGYRIHSRMFDKENVFLDYASIDWRLVDVEDRPK